MPTAVKMPKLGETIVEGTVARWLKAAGEPVSKLEPLLEVSTDKIDTEVPAPADGTLLQIVVNEGATVDTGTVLAYIGSADESVPSAPPATSPATSPATPPTTAREPESSSAAMAQGWAEQDREKQDREKGAPTESPAPSEPSGADKPSGRDFVSPVVARMVAEHDIDLAQISGSGRGGRVTKKDVLAFIERREEASPPQEEQQAAASGQVTEDEGQRTENKAPTADEILHPLTTMRRAIAQHMVQSKATSPHVTTIFEVDMTAVVRHREGHKRTFLDKGLILTYTPYFLAATAAALRAEPRVNSRFSERGIVVNRRVHVGVAVALDDGLIVPVVRDADEKNLQGLTRAVNEVAERARGGQLAPDETRGGTFTLTNHGVSGSLIGTPILNQPQAGILGVGAIVKRPVVRSASASLLPDADDAIVIRPMCYLNFTFDHRVLDGAEADRFVARVKQTLETWA